MSRFPISVKVFTNFNTNCVYGHLNGTMRPRKVRPEVQWRLDELANHMLDFNQIMVNSNGRPSGSQLQESLDKVSEHLPTNTR
uniref:Uncharacterized protein n=1 Tax=Acrobeloides nanus TaxID=290746 RepID=A0A914CKX3_9BILA